MRKALSQSFYPHIVTRRECCNVVLLISVLIPWPRVMLVVLVGFFESLLRVGKPLFGHKRVVA